MSDAPTKSRLSPLHTHTNYSVLDGASSIDDYLKWCKENGSPGLGLSDHGWMIGAKELVEKANKAGITPLPGCEFYVAPDKDYVFAGRAYDYYHVTCWAINEKGYRNLLKLGSLAWDRAPFRGEYKETKDRKTKEKSLKPVSRVVTKWGTQEKPRITFDELLQYNEGLVLGSGCLIGALGKAFMNGEFKGAERNLEKLLTVYKDRMFMELMPHVCDNNYDRDVKGFTKNECTDWSPQGDVQKSVNLEIIKTAKKYKLPLLMTIDSHFTTPDKKKIQDILLSNGDPSGWRFHNSYHMMTTEDAWKHWVYHHGDDVEQRKIFTEAVENNDVLVGMAKGFNVKDEYQQPTPPIPIDIQTAAVDKSEALKGLLFRQIDYHGRMNWDDSKYVDRLMTEIKVICDNGIADFGNYFGSLEDWCRWAADNSILSAPGRGSGAGSLLCYLLKITHLDPFQYGLPFERFLSDARIKRGKFPDIDWDMGNRDLLVAYLRQRYGNRMAQASTLHMLKIKSAIKDASRSIMGSKYDVAKIEAVTKLLPDTEPQGVASKDVILGYSDSDGNIHDGWIMQYPALDTFFKENPEVHDCVMQLLGIPRAVSRHASAYLISDRPIEESAPTCVISGYLCTQYNAAASFNSVEKAGLIKFDFLRVNTLDDVSNCIRMVQKKFGYKVWDEEVEYDNEKFAISRGDLRIDQLPIDDKGTVLDIYNLPEDQEVFSELSEGRTETVFQMNSPLMTGFTKRIKPNRMMDMSDIVALVRPGPLEADTGVQIAKIDMSNSNVSKKWKDGTEKTTYTMTELYIAVRHGVLPVSYAHPGMEPILKDTYGVAVYQEQLQQMFSDLAGYSAEEADAMREMLAKKKKAEVEKAIPELRKRLLGRGWTDKQIEVFVSLCLASASYSFNRAHSASYGIVAYMSAYLKTKFPLEWWTAVLQGSSIDDIRDKGYAKVMLDAEIMYLPSVNGPTSRFELINEKVYAPLKLIERCGGAACAEILKARKLGGDFKDFQDFYERVDSRAVNEGVIRNLALAGAFDQIEPNKSFTKIIEDYHWYKRVHSLKTGKTRFRKVIVDGDETEYFDYKTGQELLDAVLIQKEKDRLVGKGIDVPEAHMHPIQLEILRSQVLPIYRLNVHEDFKKLMINAGFMYASNSIVTMGSGNKNIRAFVNTDEIKEKFRSSSNVEGIWVGVVQSSESFSYTDKKTQEKVTALKLFLANDGDVVECVLWPSKLEEIGKVDTNRIIYVIGTIKPGFDPSKWSLSVAQLGYI